MGVRDGDNDTGMSEIVGGQFILHPVVYDAGGLLRGISIYLSGLSFLTPVLKYK